MVMVKCPRKSVRLGVEALDSRLVPAVDAFIWFHSEVPTSSVAVQKTTDSFRFGTVLATRAGGEVVSSDAF
jgi:hypothetical protein